MFLDFYEYQIACEVAEFFDDSTEMPCKMRDLIGYYLNAFGWCTELRYFHEDGWSQCAKLSMRFPRPNLGE